MHHDKARSQKGVYRTGSLTRYPETSNFVSKSPSPFGNHVLASYLLGIVAVTIAAVLAIALSGCGPEAGGVVHFFSLQPAGQTLQQLFPQAYYKIDPHGQICVVCLTGNEQDSEQFSEHDTQMLVLRTFWIPHKSRTPTHSSTTNMNADLLTCADGAAAIYRGAGFLMLKAPQPPLDVDLDVRACTIRLTNCRPDFAPVFNRANLTGKATALFDPAAVDRQLKRLEEQRLSLIKE